MKKTTIAILSFLFCFTINAQQKEDMNFKGERVRIEQGVKSGQITKREAEKIYRDMKEVQRVKNKAKADGVITKSERRRIAKKDAKLDKTIYNTKNNKRRR